MQSKLDKYYLLTVAINLHLFLPCHSVLRGFKTLKYPTTFASQEHQALLWQQQELTQPLKNKKKKKGQGVLGVHLNGRRGRGWGRDIHENMEDDETEPLPKGSQSFPFPVRSATLNLRLGGLSHPVILSNTLSPT